MSSKRQQGYHETGSRGPRRESDTNRGVTSLGENIHSRYDSIFSIDTEGMTSLFQARHRVLGTLHALRVMRQPAG